ncbi:MAG TPA: amino acid permease, partial [Gemmataceae bacterium]|nr:amino acid permease [Gemmataceae bacterium]
MLWKRLFATKSIEQLHKEMAEDEGRLRRALGPVALTSLGIGAIIGAGIFVMTGRVAANNAGPGILLSYTIAGIGCALAAFCYAEFASMAPVAGSAYTYAYATLGELLAWIIGWDLILEYAMSCATVASAWSEYFNKFTEIVFHWKVPDNLSNDPFSFAGAYLNLPAVLILVVITAILVIGIRESAISNTVLVIVKLGVVLFVICVGLSYVSSRNWTSIFVEDRKMSEQTAIPDASEKIVKAEDQLLNEAETLSPLEIKKSVRKVLIELENGQTEGIAPPNQPDRDERIRELSAKTLAIYLRNRIKQVNEELLAKKEINADQAKERAQRIEEEIQKMFRHVDKDDKLHLNNITPEDERRAAIVLKSAKEEAAKAELENWGLLGIVGLNKSLAKLDNSTRTKFTPYGLSGV